MSADMKTTDRGRKEAEAAIFAVVQEAIGNAKKYAQAENMWIEIRHQGDRLLVDVRDDGQGFDPARLDESGGMGLAGMKQRVSRIEGKLKIASAPGQGTTVKVSSYTFLPIK